MKDYKRLTDSGTAKMLKNTESEIVADSEARQSIMDLLIEFDEMGFAPTTVCHNSEQYAIDWCERVRKEFNRLTAENERLRTENAELIKSDTSKEHCIIEEHNEVHYWRYRAKQAEEDVYLREKEIIELKARLENAVELKAKVGDVIYMPWEYDGSDGVATLSIIGIDFHNDEFIYITDLESDSAYYLEKYKFGIFRNEDFDSIVFTDRSEACGTKRG